jgi:hypothetical protein
MQFLSLTSPLFCNILKSSYFYKYCFMLATKHLLYSKPIAVSRELSTFTQNISREGPGPRDLWQAEGQQLGLQIMSKISRAAFHLSELFSWQFQEISPWLNELWRVNKMEVKCLANFPNKRWCFSLGSIPATTATKYQEGPQNLSQ